jgi:hypothetical protein
MVAKKKTTKKKATRKKVAKKTAPLKETAQVMAEEKKMGTDIDSIEADVQKQEGVTEKLEHEVKRLDGSVSTELEHKKRSWKPIIYVLIGLAIIAAVVYFLQ